MNKIICYLTDEFYEKYSNTYLEMEKKKDRPYHHLILSYKENQVVIPFRHHISHKYCYPTSSIIDGKCQGLDFSKALIIDKQYISNKEATVDSTEFNIIKQNLYRIQVDFEKYVNLYKKNFKKIQKGNKIASILNMCKFSCLQYFHNELELWKTERAFFIKFKRHFIFFNIYVNII